MSVPTSVKDRKTFLFGSVLAALALLLGSLALALPGVNPLRGEELLSIECADIVFGTGKYTESASPKLESLEHSGIALSGIESSFCYFKPGEGGLRLGSKNNPGSITFFFDGAYRVSKARVYCYRYEESGSASFAAYTDVSGTPDYQTVDWSTVPSIDGTDDPNCLYFLDLDRDGLSATSLTIAQERTGRVMVCKIVLTLLVGSGGNEPSSSSSSSSSSGFPSGEGSSLEEEFLALAPATQEYYSEVPLGLSGSELKSSFAATIADPAVVSYNRLMDVYEESDVDPEGYLYDIYSDAFRHRPAEGWSGNNAKEGDGLNREHVIPKSYFGSLSPMYSDAFSVVPADGYSNLRRSNYPYGEVLDATYETSNGSKLGSNVYPGYAGTVFEVGDEWKGDIARIHFYFVTCYEAEMGSSGWQDYPLFDYSSPLGLSGWATDMFLEWAREDPISERERERNDAVYSFQGNRNPYVDFPSLAQEVFA